MQPYKISERERERESITICNVHIGRITQQNIPNLAFKERWGMIAKERNEEETVVNTLCISKLFPAS
jgi:hypothetical protein